MMDRSHRRRQNQACLTCRRRKVRCDAAGAVPCNPCRQQNVECQPNPKWRRSQSLAQGSQSPIAQRSGAQVWEGPANRIEAPLHRPVASLRNVESDPPAEVVENSLSTFLERGATSSSWTVFTERNERIVYTGTEISNIWSLVKNEHENNYIENQAVTGLKVHYPFPRTCSPLPWKPQESGASQHTPAGKGLLELSSFPTRAVRDALVDSYFDLIHPGYPIIDERDFRLHYEDASDPPPLILFQAVLLAGAHVTRHPLVASSRKIVTATLFKRAKTLFEIRHENDRLHLVQAALLLAWHVENADTASSNSYHWLGLACRIAFGLGMHRDLSDGATSLMPVQDRRIYRRVWWTMFSVEIFSALEYGRPCMIRLEDFDQPPLCSTDFIDRAGIFDSKIEQRFMDLNIELSYIVLDILILHSPAMNRQSTALPGTLPGALSGRLPGLSVGPQKALSDINARLGALAIKMPSDDGFWSCQLCIHYNLVLLQLHRNLAASKDSQQQNESRDIASEAASVIIAAFESVTLYGRTSQCLVTSNGAIMAATIQVSREIKAALNRQSLLLALNAQKRLLRLLSIAKHIAVFWPNAEATSRLCQTLDARFDTMIKADHENRPAMQDFDPVGTPKEWYDIFADLEPFSVDNTTDNDDLLYLSSFLDTQDDGFAS